MTKKVFFIYGLLALFFGTLFYLGNNYVYNGGEPVLPWHPIEFSLCILQAIILLCIPFMVNRFFKPKGRQDS